MASKTVEAAKELLASLQQKAPTPWRFDSVSSPVEGYTIGAFRAKDGRNVLEPHAESASMVVSSDEAIAFITKAPKVIEALLREAEKTV